MNSLVHNFEVEGAHTAETVDQLTEALRFFGVDGDTYLASTYRIELIAETLSDGSVARSIRIREAEAV